MQTARLGLVIGKRAVRRAVDRNRAKRVLRETFRIRRRELASVDIVVQLTGPVGGSDLRALFGGLLEELRNIDR
jgi:ribonuclease P protein component